MYCIFDKNNSSLMEKNGIEDRIVLSVDNTKKKEKGRCYGKKK